MAYEEELLPPKKLKIKFEEVKHLLLDRDFEFYLKLNFEENTYQEVEKKMLYKTYSDTKKLLEKKIKENPKQYQLYIEAVVKKCSDTIIHFFKLSDLDNTMFDLPAYGEMWAYFEFWQKHEKRKLKWQNFWKYSTRIGVTLAYLLTIAKIIDIITKNLNP